MAIALNNAELSALAGLPHFVICLYVMAIRPRMNFQDGAVGINPRISWQALGEWLYVEPAQGRKDSGSPHKSAIRRAAAQLQKSGLIQSIGNEEALVFSLPLANKGTCAANKPDTNPTHQPDTPKPAPAKAARVTRDTHETPKADIHLVTDIKTTPPPNPLEGEMPEVVENLNFPNSITSHQTGEIKKIFVSKGISAEDAQLILDEYHGQTLAKQIGNAVGYIRRMADRMQRGEFIGDRAAMVREQRDKSRAAEVERARQTELMKKEASRSRPTAKDLELLPAGLRARLSRAIGEGALQ